MKKLSFEEMENVRGGIFYIPLETYCGILRYIVFFGTKVQSDAAVEEFNNSGFC